MGCTFLGVLVSFFWLGRVEGGWENGFLVSGAGGVRLIDCVCALVFGCQWE